MVNAGYGKFHDPGICCKFRQIACWTDSAVGELGSRLSFKNRIHSDDLTAQAEPLHGEEYEEKFSAFSKTEAFRV